jgi:hypothetical protein
VLSLSKNTFYVAINLPPQDKSLLRSKFAVSADFPYQDDSQVPEDYILLHCRGTPLKELCPSYTFILLQLLNEGVLQLFHSFPCVFGIPDTLDIVLS